MSVTRSTETAFNTAINFFTTKNYVNAAFEFLKLRLWIPCAETDKNAIKLYLDTINLYMAHIPKESIDAAEAELQRQLAATQAKVKQQNDENLFELAKQSFFQPADEKYTDAKKQFQQLQNGIHPDDELYKLAEFYLMRIDNKLTEKKSELSNSNKVLINPMSLNYPPVPEYYAQYGLFTPKPEEEVQPEKFDLNFIKQTTREAVASAGRAIMSLTGRK